MSDSLVVVQNIFEWRAQVTDYENAVISLLELHWSIDWPIELGCYNTNNIIGNASETA